MRIKKNSKKSVTILIREYIPAIDRKGKKIYGASKSITCHETSANELHDIILKHLESLEK